ncbi:hypothetical protein DEO72_LG1g2743 [Vigna unguiculata]|uniref:Uncharacterized protein n=1 Tax=Vigna unguiculata TaxID=3917 RepID=A0A4D6KYU6_VIGUN|nr:hypothetical protein DEO72_LG1g2743 [Vigna unguiculata]
MGLRVGPKEKPNPKSALTHSFYSLSENLRAVAVSLSARVKEARTLWYGVIVVCTILGAMKTVARVDNLAQANLPRLGKMSKHSPRTFHASGRSSDQLSFERAKGARLSERPSRFSETLQPERRAGRECVPVRFQGRASVVGT